MEETFRKAALEYHEQGRPGKISVTPTKQLSNQRDLALAYSPGVAAACEEIVTDPANAFRYTARGNLVGVITNGTAVLGLGNIGPLASKPVMEGKAVLFKKFAGIDVFDIEINEQDPDKLVEIIAGLEPTFGGINLEDIKAPECFTVERKLRDRMRIPVFHDDQHGTAICVSAAFINGLKVVDKDISKVKVAVSGAGAAALACLDLMVDLGLPLENIWVSDIEGVVYQGRPVLMDPDKERFAQKTDARTLAEIVKDADVFLGLSAGGVLKPEMVKTMAKDPLIMALANPNPEILPSEAKAVRPDAILATGRTDYPNQVNNVLCFPYIFRGALDCGATKITEAMKLACVRQIADLAKADISEEVECRALVDRAVAHGVEHWPAWVGLHEERPDLREGPHHAPLATLPQSRRAGLIQAVQAAMLGADLRRERRRQVHHGPARPGFRGRAERTAGGAKLGGLGTVLLAGDPELGRVRDHGHWRPHGRAGVVGAHRSCVFARLVHPREGARPVPRQADQRARRGFEPFA